MHRRARASCGALRGPVPSRPARGSSPVRSSSGSRSRRPGRCICSTCARNSTTRRSPVSCRSARSPSRAHGRSSRLRPGVARKRSLRTIAPSRRSLEDLRSPSPFSGFGRSSPTAGRSTWPVSPHHLLRARGSRAHLRRAVAARWALARCRARPCVLCGLQGARRDLRHRRHRATRRRPDSRGRLSGGSGLLVPRPARARRGRGSAAGAGRHR